MYSILLIIIYIAFISLGLPDSVLGSAWPSMQPDLAVPVSYAGGISLIIAGGTIISSLFSNYLIHKLGTGKVTAISVAMTAAALFGFSISGSYWQLCLWGIPYGLGAGSVDAALNNFVALHYKAKHMSWLHCFWGIGATAGPYIMGFVLTRGFNWTMGYRTISILQIVLTAILIFTLPLWKEKKDGREEDKQHPLSLPQVIKLPGAKGVLIGFFCYCSVEATAGLWASSYMVLNRGISTETAAKWAALFYLGITLGRLVCGFVTMKVNDKNMIRIGQSLMALGILFLLLPFGNGLAFGGLILIGLGCAPVYPSLIHATPDTFGAEVSQSVIGVQMASAYVGTTFMPPLFGMLSEVLGIGFYPVYIAAFLVLMVVMLEGVNRIKIQT
ncbi:MAG: MFS transporter [Lachnospiraceae bacterium]|nr:MFS transporter [Lachnospiraceae bacterium]